MCRSTCGDRVQYVWKSFLSFWYVTLWTTLRLSDWGQVPLLTQPCIWSSYWHTGLSSFETFHGVNSVNSFLPKCPLIWVLPSFSLMIATDFQIHFLNLRVPFLTLSRLLPPELWAVLCDAQRSSPLAILEPTPLLHPLWDLHLHFYLDSMLSSLYLRRVSGSLSSNSKEIPCVTSGPLCLFRFFVNGNIVNFRGQDKDHVYFTWG